MGDLFDWLETAVDALREHATESNTFPFLTFGSIISPFSVT